MQAMLGLSLAHKVLSATAGPIHGPLEWALYLPDAATTACRACLPGVATFFFAS